VSFLSTPTARKRVRAENLFENEIQWVEEHNLQPEGAQAGLATDSAGVVYTGVSSIYVDGQLVRHIKSAYLEFTVSAITSGAGIKCHLYDRDDAVDIASSDEVTAATDRTRVSVAAATLEAAIGHELTVRWEVTTTAAGGTFNADMARLVLVKGVS